MYRLLDDLDEGALPMDVEAVNTRQHSH
jgi:hypothetical protein